MHLLVSVLLFILAVKNLLAHVLPMGVMGEKSHPSVQCESDKLSGYLPNLQSFPLLGEQAVNATLTYNHTYLR